MLHYVEIKVQFIKQHTCTCMWAIPPGQGTICDGVNCYICKCTIYYPWLWLLINIVVISYWRWRDWFHSNLKNNCECALIIKDTRWYIYGCNNWHRHKSCPNLVEWPISCWLVLHNSNLNHAHWLHFSLRIFAKKLESSGLLTNLIQQSQFLPQE